MTWSRDQYLRIHSLDLEQYASKELEKLKNSKEEDDDLTSINTINKQHHSALQLQQTNTTNSSRKSSISEYTYGTPPTSNLTSIRTVTNNERESSFNQESANFVNELIRPSLNHANSHNLLKSASSIISPHEFLKKIPNALALNLVAYLVIFDCKS